VWRLSISVFLWFVMLNSTFIQKKIEMFNVCDEMNFSWTRFFRRFSKTNAFEIFKSIMSIANNLLIAQLKDIHEYSFKSNQIKVIQCFFDERDVIFFAKTKNEKNMILYSLFVLKIDIIILLIFFKMFWRWIKIELFKDWTRMSIHAFWTMKLSSSRF
jgi:hypothetical protein